MMKGSLKVYCSIARRHKEYAQRYSLYEIGRRTSDAYVSYNISTQWMRDCAYKKKALLMEYEMGFREHIIPVEEKHLLYSKDVAPVVMLSEGSTLLLPDGYKAKILEATCDIEGNVVYHVDRKIIEDDPHSFYNSVVTWLMLEFPKVKNFSEMYKYRYIKKSERDLELAERIAEIDFEYNELLNRFTNVQDKVVESTLERLSPSDGDRLAKHFNREVMKRQLEREDGRVLGYLGNNKAIGTKDYSTEEKEYEIKVGNGDKRYEITVQSNASAGDIAAYALVASIPIGIVLMFGKLLLTPFFGG